MSRAWINFWLDSLLLCLFCALMAVSTIVRFVFPPIAESRSWRLWGGNLHDWSDLQFGLIAALALAILVHVMLHWNWVCGLLAAKLSCNRKGRVDEALQTIYGVGLLIVLLTLIGGVIAAAQLTIERLPS